MGLTDNESKLVQVMAWYCQAISRQNMCHNSVLLTMQKKTQNKTTVVFLVQNIGCLKLHPEMVQADHKPK